MDCRLEHANITVRSIEETVEFLTTAFPNFKIRGGSMPDADDQWVHLGTDSTYIALNEASTPPNTQAYQGVGVNHLGFVVGDVDGIRKRLEQAGYKEGFISEPHPYRKRIYFHDNDGLEWEFVQYLSDDLARRNDYTL